MFNIYFNEAQNVEVTLLAPHQFFLTLGLIMKLINKLTKVRQ